jgi:hypothetical protein
LLRAVALGYDVGTRLTMSQFARVSRGRTLNAQFRSDLRLRRRGGALAGLNYEQTRTCCRTVQQASGVSCWARDVDHIEKLRFRRHARAQWNHRGSNGQTWLYRCRGRIFGRK